MTRATEVHAKLSHDIGVSPRGPSTSTRRRRAPSSGPSNAPASPAPSPDTAVANSPAIMPAMPPPMPMPGPSLPSGPPGPSPYFGDAVGPYGWAQRGGLTGWNGMPLMPPIASMYHQAGGPVSLAPQPLSMLLGYPPPMPPGYAPPPYAYYPHGGYAPYFPAAYSSTQLYNAYGMPPPPAGPPPEPASPSAPPSVAFAAPTAATHPHPPAQTPVNRRTAPPVAPELSQAELSDIASRALGSVDAQRCFS